MKNLLAVILGLGLMGCSIGQPVNRRDDTPPQKPEPVLTHIETVAAVETALDAVPTPAKSAGRTELKKEGKVYDSIVSKASTRETACATLAHECLIDDIDDILWWFKWLSVPLGLVVAAGVFYLLKNPKLALYIGLTISAFAPLAWLASVVLAHMAVSVAVVIGLLVIVGYGIETGVNVGKKVN
jgi:hypothetical protein